MRASLSSYRIILPMFTSFFLFSFSLFCARIHTHWHTLKSHLFMTNGYGISIRLTLTQHKWDERRREKKMLCVCAHDIGTYAMNRKLFFELKEVIDDAILVYMLEPSQQFEPGKWTNSIFMCGISSRQKSSANQFVGVPVCAREKEEKNLRNEIWSVTISLCLHRDECVVWGEKKVSVIRRTLRQLMILMVTIHYTNIEENKTYHLTRELCDAKRFTFNFRLN